MSDATERQFAALIDRILRLKDEQDAIGDPITDLCRIGRERFNYDPSSGKLTWRDPGEGAFPSRKGYNIFKRKFAGKPAGSIKKKSGYVLVYVLGRSILAHRLIWAMVHGRDPVGDIDHRDMCRSNNRIENLREATRSQNCMNKAMRPENRSGVKGVHWHKASRKWTAAISANGNALHIGTFSTLDEAIKARTSAAEMMHSEFARETYNRATHTHAHVRAA